MLNINISTVDRARNDARNFLQGTLDSLYKTPWIGWVNLFFNSRSTDYADTRRPYLSSYVVTDEEVELLKRLPTHHKAAYNYWRTLSHDEGACVVFEDDVHFSDNWFEFLYQTVNEIEQRHDHYVLSLYCCYDDSRKSPYFYWPYPLEGFYGTQGMYFPGSVKEQLTDYFHDHAVLQCREPYDMLIKRFCRDHQIPLFSCRRSLIQHSAPGDSTGLGGGHQTSTFQQRIEYPPGNEIFRSRPGVLERCETGYSIVSEQVGLKHEVNESLVLIWSGFAEGATLGKLTHELEDAFPEQREAVARDIRNSVSKLRRRGLLSKIGTKRCMDRDDLFRLFNRYCSCRFKGQLGNQLFQIAATLSHGRRHNRMPLIPRFDHRRYFNSGFLQVEALPDNTQVYVPPSFAYTEIPDPGNIVLDGFFQSEKYFEEPVVRQFLSPRPDVVEHLRQRYQDLLAAGPVSVHVRRTDYCSMPDCHPVLPMSYYHQAMDELGQDRSYLVFSDDIAWCKQHFPRHDGVVFIQDNTAAEDMILMSLCRDHIIANSTFSWWGAWLNSNDDKRVVAPLTWFGSAYSNHGTEDLIPEGWLRI